MMYNQSTSGFQGGPNIMQRNTIPVPNIIKSVTLNNPSISIDFLEFAGIR